MSDENVVQVENNLNSLARQARREKVKEAIRESGVLVEHYVCGQSSEMIAYPSEVFLTDYNQRLPEWRVRGSRSARNPHWANWKEYQMAILAFTLGLTNIVHLPLAAMQYGSGTFVISYVLVELLIGFPILFLELAIGQFSSKDIIHTFSVVPVCTGVGMMLVIYNLVNIIRSHVKFAWIVYSMYNVFDGTFPYSQECEWNDKLSEHFKHCGHYDIDLLNKTGFKCFAKFFHFDVQGLTDAACAVEGTSVGSAKSMFWPMVGCMAVVNLIALALISKGITSLGKVFVWTVPLTCAMLMIFMFTDIFQFPECLQGVQRFFTPTWEHFIDIRMWVSVLSLVIRSLKLDTGVMINVGSYARFQCSTHKHAFYACVADISVSLICSTILSSFLGVVTHTTGVSHEELVEQVKRGHELNFFAINVSAISGMYNVVSFWILLFLGIMLLMAVMNEAAYILMIFKTLHQYFPKLLKHNWITNISTIAFSFVITLPFLTHGTGAGWLAVNVFRIAPMNCFPFLNCFLIVSTFVYVYGIRRLRQDIDFMLQFHPNIFFCVLWIASPILIAIALILLVTLPGMHRRTLRAEDVRILWTLFIILLLPIFINALQKVIFYSKRGEVAKLFYSRAALSAAVCDVGSASSNQSPDSSEVPDMVRTAVVRTQEQSRIEGIQSMGSTSFTRKRVFYEGHGGTTSTSDSTSRSQLTGRNSSYRLIQPSKSTITKL